MTHSSENTLTYTPYTVYRVSYEKDFIVHFFGLMLLGFLVLLLIVAEYYLKSMYAELEILRIENETLSQKLDELTRSQE